MAGKNHQPAPRCGECRHCDSESYRGVGKVVCYEVQRLNDRKIAVQITENQKACGKFRAPIRTSRG